MSFLAFIFVMMGLYAAVVSNGGMAIICFLFALLCVLAAKYFDRKDKEWNDRSIHNHE